MSQNVFSGILYLEFEGTTTKTVREDKEKLQDN